MSRPYPQTFLLILSGIHFAALAVTAFFFSTFALSQADPWAIIALVILGATAAIDYLSLFGRNQIAIAFSVVIHSCCGVLFLGLTLLVATKGLSQAILWLAFISMFQIAMVYHIARWGAQVTADRDPTLCPTCAYDIRATPTRCPECGSPLGEGESLGRRSGGGGGA